MNRVILMAQHITEWQQYDFQWGKHDCFFFAALGLKLLGAKDITAEFKGYRSERGAAKKLSDHGMSCVSEIFAANFARADRLMVGDAAVIEAEGTRAMGLVTGPRVHVMTQTRGLRAVPRSWAVEGFRV